MSAIFPPEDSSTHSAPRPSPESAPNAALMRSLGRLVRGLSAIFWGLPMALILGFHTARADALRSLGIIPPVFASGLLVFGLWLLGDFQKQERIWRRALDTARILAMVNFGLSPFVYWWNRLPNNTFFFAAVITCVFCALLLLGSLNVVLQRLGAMLPDEALRQEIRGFTVINLNLLGATMAMSVVAMFLAQSRSFPLWMGPILNLVDHDFFWLPLLLVLLPLAITMALIWKTKEVILESIFNSKV